MDEVFDTGTTLARLRRFMADRGALSVRAAVAVVKEVKRAPEIVLPEYIGFHAPDRYLVGYGLDSSEDGRQLPFIAAV